MLLFLVVGSCKKEILTAEKIDPELQKQNLANSLKPKIETVNLSQFKSKINFNALGTLKSAFVDKPNTGKNAISISTPETYLGFTIETDSIKMIKDKGHTMYVFPVVLASKNAISFQNLTIDESATGTVAFVNTYTPTKQWIASWEKGHPGKFDGDISVTYLKLNNGSIPNGLANSSKNTNQNTIAVVRVCTSTTYYFEIPYNCASGHHAPEDSGCTLVGSERAGYALFEAIITECVDLPDPPAPGGGTSPTPPSGYNPCPGATPGVSGKKSFGNKITIVPPTPCDSVAAPAPTKEEKLVKELEVNPDLLIDCATAKLFKSLASHKPTQSVYDRINTLNNGSNTTTLFSNPYFVQQIKNAVGYKINLDRFEINISTLPIVNGIRLNAEQYLDYIRKNLNQFIDNSYATFQPYFDSNDNINDAVRWNSTNPLGSILHLEMADNGSVIVSDYNSNHWTVSTLRTPIDAGHPVSGNRSWGFDYDPNLGYTFYVTGVDRVTLQAHEVAQYILNIPFSNADKLWKSYQSLVTNFVNSHQGSATVGKTITERPNYQAVKDYFDGKITLENLKNLKGCK